MNCAALLCTGAPVLEISVSNSEQKEWWERKQGRYNHATKYMGNKLQSSIVASDSWDGKCPKNIWLLSAEACSWNLNKLSGLFPYQMWQRAEQTVQISHYLKSPYWIVWHLEIHLPVRYHAYVILLNLFYLSVIKSEIIMRLNSMLLEK